MGAPFGYGLWSWFAGNKMAQYIATAGIAYVIYRILLARHNERIREDERRRNLERARQAQKQIERKSHEKSEQAAVARRDAPRGLMSSQLPNGPWRRLIRDERDG